MDLEIELSDEVADRLEARMKSSDFDSTEEYVKFVIDQVTAHHPELEGPNPSSDDRRTEVRDQLQSLGYLE